MVVRDADADPEEKGLTVTSKEGVPVPVIEDGIGDEITKGTPIRKFSDVNLNTYIDRHLASLPPGEGDKGAVIAYVTTEGAKLATVGRKEVKGGELAWTAVASVPWKGGLDEIEAEGAVRYSW